MDSFLDGIHSQPTQGGILKAFRKYCFRKKVRDNQRWHAKTHSNKIEHGFEEPNWSNILSTEI